MGGGGGGATLAADVSFTATNEVRLFPLYVEMLQPRNGETYCKSRAVAFYLVVVALTDSEKPAVAILNSQRNYTRYFFNV